MEGSTLNTCWLLQLKPSVSRAAYRVLMNSEALLLPGEENVRDLMNKTSSDNNLKKPFYEIIPKKLLVNILFDDVKQGFRFSEGHPVGHVENKPGELDTLTLVIEIVCHFCGPTR